MRCSGSREYTSLVPSMRPMAKRRPFGDQATTVTGDCPGMVCSTWPSATRCTRTCPVGVSDQQRGPVGGDGHGRQAEPRAGQGGGSDDLRALEVDDHPGGLPVGCIPHRRGREPGEPDRCPVACGAERCPEQPRPLGVGVVTGHPWDGHGLRADPALTASVPDAHLPREHRDQGAPVGRDAKQVPVCAAPVRVGGPAIGLRPRHLLPRACRFTGGHLDREQPRVAETRRPRPGHRRSARSGRYRYPGPPGGPARRTG